MTDVSFRKSLYKMAWDTRCRNVDVARILRPIIDSGTTIIDAGCGEYGLSAFIDARSVVGVDILPTDAKTEGFEFVHGSILALPFVNRSFSIAASVDVLEHLPAEIRSAAIKQLVDAAKETIIITFPCGRAARTIDEDFRRNLEDSNLPIPDWLTEHLENPYPEADAVAGEIESKANETGRKVRTRIFYSESLSVAKWLRWAATRSKYIYLAGNLAAGFLLPLMPKPDKNNAYRAIILAEFDND